METGSTCATGGLWGITWMPCCWPPAGASWAVAPAWEAMGSAPTSRWWKRSAARLDALLPAGAPHGQPITPVTDRPWVLAAYPCWAGQTAAPERTWLQSEVDFGAAFVASRLTTAAGAALIGVDA
jgi:hypothetical protein